ncbi:MAG: hypothetical protein J6P03_01200 [Opitutales bacterium]|nr:hypothetical protein [Opitutales bacterium]
MPTFSKTFSVRCSEIDRNYLLQRESIPFFFEECFAQYCASISMAGYDMTPKGLTWIISDIAIAYVAKMPFWKSEIKVDIFTSAITPLYLKFDYALSCGGKIFAKGAFRAIIAELAAHKPKRATDFAENFSLSDPSEFSETAIEKIAPFGEKLGETVQRVRLADLDFNQHLNNARYLPRILESVPEGVRENFETQNFSIRFQNEAKLRDEILSETFGDEFGKKFFHKLTRVSDGKTLCVAASAFAPAAK